MSEVSFIEMGSIAPEKTSHFFAALLGWTFHPIASQASPGGGWFETSTGGKVGLHGNDGAGAVLYFRVENMESAVAQVRALGGSAEDTIADEPGFGRFCNCADPQGLRFGLHQLA
ncbi:VOC family protein [Comamonas testosteroni]|uniref:VOC domain-containing protein n=1 Tax=Comamonas testosteroni (strain DSM 14576 / KF-1) TaxID=399795 RepID=B7WS13_COMTK|nr:VOC family protein [Comamonas testosteroni]EED69067.1 conserved hypothetical protein [Comamonas testosteroni KF-1]WQG67056.1 VOC family protein [Comamonas testosteroni]